MFDSKTYNTSVRSNLVSTLDIKNEIEAEIKKKQIILNSLTDSIIDLIKSLDIIFSSKTIIAAFHQQNKKKKSERHIYEFVKDEMISTFFNGDKDAKLKQIIMSGESWYACLFEFAYCGYIFRIQIPIVSNVNKDNLIYVWDGKYVLHYRNKYNDAINYFLESSYEPEKIRNKILFLVNS